MASKWFTEAVDKKVSGVLPSMKKEPTPVYDKVIKELKKKNEKKKEAEK